MTSHYSHFGVVGAGAWGTALAAAIVRSGRDVTLWAREPEVAQDIVQNRENAVYLKGIELPCGIHAVSELAGLTSCDAFVLAAPAQHTCGMVTQLVSGRILGSESPVILAAKGIVQQGACLLSEAVAPVLSNNPLAVLSGPSFAHEVARDLPMALVLACRDSQVGEALVEAMGRAAFRLYLSEDVVGAQLGGALKNVLAIACGIVTGREMGDNARSALVTRGLAEMTRLGRAMGANARTLAGLSGLGDVVLTCSSLQSRNMSLGVELGQGRRLDEVLGARVSVAEGVYSASAALELASRYQVEMPIVAAVHAILNEGAEIGATIQALLARPMRREDG